MSLRLKTILGIALIELLLSGVLIVASVSILRTTNEEALASEARSVTSLFTEIVRGAVASDDLARLDSLTSGLLTQANIAFARVVDADGKVLSSAGESPPAGASGSPGTPASCVGDITLLVRTAVAEGANLFGHTEICFSTEVIGSLVASATKKLLLLATAGLVLSALLSFFLGTYLTRRRAGLRSTAEGGIGPQLSPRGRDEASGTAMSMDRVPAEPKDNYQDLKDRERRTRNVLDNIADAVVTANAEGTIRGFNFAAERLFGYRFNEIVGSPLSMLMPEDRAAGNGTALQRLLTRAKEKTKYSLEHDGRRRDGALFPAEICISHVEVEYGTCYICIIRDLTERRMSEEGARLARQVFVNSGEAILVTDMAKRTVAANPAFTHLTGYTEDEFIGRLSSDLHSYELQPDHVPWIRSSIAKYGHWSGEVWHKRKDGTTYPAWMTSSEIKDENGDTTHFVAIFRDITEQKRIERMKSEFVSTVSHELRTPLTAIKGSLDLVVSGLFGPLPGKAGDLLGKAADNCQRLSRLINDILDLEKLESGMMEFVKEPCRVSRLLEEAVSAYGSYAADCGVKCVIVGNPIETNVLADRPRIMQVLANLISNASKYSPDGAAVELSASRCDTGIRFSVRDFGPGVPEEFRREIFSKFAQADSSDGRAQSGTGLGLVISKTIIEEHGGDIGYTTQPGADTTFYFIIPESVPTLIVGKTGLTYVAP